VEALVDTGASDTVLPREVLDELGVQPLRKKPYRLADDRIAQFDVGEARLRMDGEENVVPVVFGERAGPVLLGATTLEIFKLGVDPVGRLVPVTGVLFMIFPNDRAQG
jgi:clan AA aspartic protease